MTEEALGGLPGGKFGGSDYGNSFLLYSSRDDCYIKCSQCGVCCKLFLITLTEQEYRSNKYKTEFEEFGLTKAFKEAEMCGANIITQKKDESCIYLENGKCSIHDIRPKACREFFCSSKDPTFKSMIDEVGKFKISSHTVIYED